MRIRIRQKKADSEGYSGKENELEGPGGQGQLTDFQTFE